MYNLSLIQENIRYTQIERHLQKKRGGGLFKIANIMEEKDWGATSHPERNWANKTIERNVGS